jgi:hypothetical protein
MESQSIIRIMQTVVLYLSNYTSAVIMLDLDSSVEQKSRNIQKERLS